MDFYVSIGNSDNKLSQKRWSEFQGTVVNIIQHNVERIYGVWYSLPNSEFQNCCIGYSVSDAQIDLDIRRLLSAMARRFDQDSIALCEGRTVFLS